MTWKREWPIAVALAASALNVVNERWLRVDAMSRALRAEDHLVEWATFGAFLVAGLLALRMALGQARARRRTTWLVLAAGTLFVAGEEVSWFQRLLGFTTPSRLATLNSQGETTVHNLVLFGLPLTTWVFTYGLGVLMTLYFFGLPWMCERFARISDTVSRWGIPTPPVEYGFVLVALLVLSHGLAPGTSGNEVMEMGGAIVWLRLLMRGSSVDAHDLTT